MKVLLLEPLYPSDAAWGSAKAEQGYLPPMGLISIYSWLKSRSYDVTILDTQFGDYTEKALVDYLRRNQFDVIGIPTFTSTADYCFDTARICKAALPHCVIVLGNIHASTMPELTMEQCPDCDFIIMGEGEFTFDELLQILASPPPHDFSRIAGLVWRNGTDMVKNAARPYISNLDILPKGFYNDLDLSRYVPHPTQYVVLPNYPFITQRGCPYTCTYCAASAIMGKKPRAFSPERVVEELKLLKYRKGARGVYFQDSTFTLSRKYVIKLLDLMLRERLDLLWSCNTRADRVDPELLALMKEAGCRQIILGIESGNQQSLDIIRKQTTVERQAQGVEWIRQAGISMVTSFIICLPGETEEMVRNTINYAKQLCAPISLFYLPVPYPGTELYEVCKASGGLRRDARWSDYLAVDFDNPVYVNPLIGKERMKYWYKRSYMEYYTYPGVWAANLKMMRSLEDLKRFGRGADAVLSMVRHGLGDFLRRGMHGGYQS